MSEKFKDSVDLMSFLQHNSNENEFFDNTEFPTKKESTNINMNQNSSNTLFSNIHDLNTNPITCFENKDSFNEFELTDDTNNYAQGPIDENERIRRGQGGGNHVGGTSSLSSLSPTTHKSSSSLNSNPLIFTNDNIPVMEESGDKKKAQNRAAQRAFRERKQAKLDSLEHQLKESEANKEALQKEVDTLRKLNQEIHAENRTLLRKHDDNNNNMSNSINYNQNNFAGQYTEDQIIEKNIIHRTREDFYKDLMKQVKVATESNSETIQNKTYEDNDGNIIMTIPATWEYLQKNYGEDIDIIKVLKSLRGKEVCHGAGGAYPKVIIDEAIKRLMDEQ
ncbi:similar to Saccharomyces cerevisiae YHL009C YAP3 Basic leucine zipper (bZIP) transcription factor [Maudiozyma saulgeensis]|uniref:Similar to Saccharomyces cerevisiae YHL009C YAP3 Basic leucine zipper (BZIP) transcription factor n=1 Tax=Maudiozyma saulgeensis TaxID=1789683 RepID=A0A1X7QZW5_9SACH|nr:similar to Saccharomyces cerevisiae YHL009C YAP3 Basic leucine zipper (bZIP) transcription factor [Kazachstania saulgeensis]